MQNQKELHSSIVNQLVEEIHQLKIDNARKDVDLTSATKTNEAWEKKFQEAENKNTKLQSKVRLGEDRISKALKGGRTRLAQIRLAFKEAAPTISDLDAHVLAIGIDLHEYFEKPDSLYCEQDGAELRVHFRRGHIDGGWQTRYACMMELPECEQKRLLQVVQDQIKKQQELFPTRLVVKKTFELHLSKCFDGVSDLESQDPSTTEKLIKAHCRKFEQQLEQAFSDLKEKNIDVEAVLLDSWQPLHMLYCLAQYDKLARKLPEVQKQVLPQKSSQEVVLRLFDMYKNSETAEF